MTTAFILLCYALAAAWCLPALLAPLTLSGASVRPALGAWLSAMVSVLLSAGLGLSLIVRTGAGDWPTLTRLICRGVVGGVCTPGVYNSAWYITGMAVLAVVIPVAALVALCCFGRRTSRAVSKTRLHARAALLAGRSLAGTDAVVLDDPRPVAYCVAGRPSAIVVTTGALALLDAPQLTAVLAHERAHLASRHHVLATATRGLAALLPFVPLFRVGASEVARLTEMAADDAAARLSGRFTLVSALLAIATGSAVPGVMTPGALAAAGYAVPARVERLLAPARLRTAFVVGLALALLCAAFLLLPGLLAALPG